jgi:ABC-type uncharacterized transport system involved in gliding motility auxiliary subunit
MTNPTRTTRRTRPGHERGQALAVVVHVLLLLLVLGQIVYLSSRHRVRFDLTSDRLWSLTDSTRDLLGGLEKRLVVEAYTSPKDKLPVALRQTRAVLDNFLDEMVQLGKGKVVVQRFDPNADKAIADRCGRIGVKPLDLRASSSTSVSLDRHWQGLRLVYGGGKQKVIEQVAPPNSFAAEAQLTPAVKEVVTEKKPKFGYMEWPAQAIGQQQPGGIGWNLLRTLDQIAKRYEFQNFKDEEAALLPADLDTLFLFRPKDLTDRQKYVLDQFVVRGGTLCVFADAVEYAIGPQRSFGKLPFALDAAGSSKKFVDQLASYGVDWRPKLLADYLQDAHLPRDRATGAFEYLALPQMSQFGQVMTPVAYPYFFHAVAVDWKVAADKLAQNDRGQPDTDLADRYRALFVPGMPADDFVFKPFKEKVGRGPGFYWPTWVGLRGKPDGTPDLPQGVEGRVLLWSSPAVLVEEPPQSVDPLGQGDARGRPVQHQKFMAKLDERFRGEPRQQAPLMVDVRGTFTSFFAGGERPKRPAEIKEEEARKAADAAKAEGAAKDGAAPADAKEGEAAQADPIGPVPPKAAEAEDTKLPEEAPMRTKGDKPGRIVVVGDADFLRDDLVRGDYRQAGGPVSVNGPAFFFQMLDWLAEDQDLVALQSRVPTDRTLKLVDSQVTVGADPRLAEQRLAATTRWVRAANVFAPALLLLLFGLCIFFARRAQKRSFLESLDSPAAPKPAAEDAR